MLLLALIVYAAHYSNVRAAKKKAESTSEIKAESCQEKPAPGEFTRHFHMDDISDRAQQALEKFDEPSLWSEAALKIRDLAQKGTLWLIIGGVVLTLGVGFLIQYTWGEAFIRGATTTFETLVQFMASVEARLMAAALIAVALLTVGWALREKCRLHALILQGIGIGLFYMVIFSASVIYGLLTTPYAFAFTALTMICASVLALRQDSEGLAWAATAIGFAAPILTGVEAASGTVDHFWFFAYYSLLNLGIFAAARFRSWRGLNLLGFLCTYIAILGWCVFDYPLHTLPRVGPFIILFFLGYTWVTVRMILKGDFSSERVSDAALLIGTPVAFCSLQFPLVWHVNDLAATTAYALGAFYVGLGYFLHRRRDDIAPEQRWTIKASLYTGVVFANIAVLLSLPPSGIAVASLLLGVAVVLAGIKTENVKVRAIGVVLQCGGALALFVDAGLSSSYIATIAAISAFSCCFAALRGDRLSGGARSVGSSPEMRLLFAWGIVWPYGALSYWAFFFGAFSFPFYVLLAFFTLAGVFFMVIGQRLGASFIQIPSLFPSLLALYLFASAIFEGSGPFPLTEFLFFPGGHPLAEMGILAWPVFFVGQFITLVILERDVAEKRNAAETETWNTILSYLHGGNFVLFTMIVAAELGHIFSRSFAGISLDWIDLIIVMFLVLIINVVASEDGFMSRLLPSRRRSYGMVGCGLLCMALCLWAVTSLLLPGDSSPMAYVPFLNPLAFAALAIFLTITWWHLRTARLYPEFEAWITGRVAVAVCVVLTMAWSTVEVARIFHFYYRVPFSIPALWNNLVFQTAITFLWGFWSLGMMRFASKKIEHHRIWNIGAVLLSCNIFKLIFADLSGSETLTRVFSFIGLGLLLILIGCLAPAPLPTAKDARPCEEV